MTGVLIACAVLLFTGILTCVVRENWKGRISALGAFIAAGLILPIAVGTLISGRTLDAVLRLSDPVGPVQFVMDPLTAFFLLPVSIGGFLASLYSIGYMKPYADKGRSLSSYYLFLSLLTASMMAVVLAQNVLFFLVVWEIMSLSSFFLVMFEHHKDNVRKAGLYYFTAMQIGAALLIAAFAISVWKSGSLEMDALSGLFAGKNSLGVGLFLLFFFGFGVKAGFIPLHTWLPKAHPAAPGPVSALMSGVMIKTGIYGILRILTLYGRPETGLSWMVFILAAATGVWGIINAAAQKDMKRLLAFSSIENIGVIGMGIGLGMIGLSYGNDVIAFLGFTGGLLHVFNHFTFKSVLFYGTGAVYLRTRTRDMEKLGGLVKTMPLTAVFFLVSSLAISGLPVFSGFISEFALYYGFLQQIAKPDLLCVVSSVGGLAALALIGVMAVLSFTKIFSIVFLGLPRTELPEPPKEAPRIMLFPMAVLTLFILWIGLLPQTVLPLLEKVVGQMTGNGTFVFPDSLAHIFSRLSLILLTFFAVFSVLYVLRRLLLRGRNVRTFKTWDCGYQKADSRIQYTGSSFAAPFLGLIGGAVPQKVGTKQVEGLFPETAHFETHHQDRIDSILIRQVLRAVAWIFKLFDWVQSGKTQQYILYGLVFLIGIIAWIIGAQR